jgi:aminopeptidase
MNHQASLLARASQNVSDILLYSLQHNSDCHQALVIYDEQNGLTKLLTEAYRQALPGGIFLNFDEVSKDEITEHFNRLAPQDTVVLIQSSNFRLNEFRIRIHLFNKQLKVIEHMRLYRNLESSWDTYVNSLAIDTGWYQNMGPKVKSILEQAQTVELINAEQVLTMTGGVEIPKLNIGDYTNMKNVGDLSKVNGSVQVYAFANQNFELNFYEPFVIQIAEGLIVGWSDNTPQSFINVVEFVAQYERPILREFGFGLNRAITRHNPLGDITAFERNIGFHASLGEKHGVYSKEGINKAKAKFHIDLYLDIESARTESELFFEKGSYVIPRN